LAADERATELLLDSLVALGLLTREGGVYTNSADADAYLRRETEHSLVGYILYSRTVLWPLWANLGDAVKEGTHRWGQAFGMEGPIFSHFFRTEESMRTFLRGMHGLGMISSPQAVAAHDLSGFRKLVDVGGGTGHLALAFLDRYPGRAAAVFDLPRVIPLTREMTAGRVECVEGDFFADALPAADLYAMARILHDWNEEKIRALLAKIHASLPDRGGLLICETLIDDDRRGPVAAFMQSLSMLTCTEGRERSAAEYEGLCLAAGFRHVAAARTGAALDAVLAIK
jgi:acetylserotonin O-methyltransferase